MKTIDLSRKSEGIEVAPASTKMDSEVYYPCLYLSDIDGLTDLPDEGTATVKFRRKNLTERTDEDGKKSFSMDLEIQSITPQGGKKEPKEKSAGEGFDENMKAAEETVKSKKSEDDNDADDERY